MWRILTKSLLFSIVIVFSASIARAQPRDNSPFSQFGLGDFIESDLPSAHSMGGLSAIYHDFYEANLENPASLGFLQYTSLQIGMYTKNSNYTRIDEKQSIWNGNMNHLSLNIPLINPLNQALERRETEFAWGTSISFRPFSQVGYDIQINDEVDTIGSVQRNFEGSGGLYQITWANGLKYKNLCAGINLSYLYGKQVFNEQTYFLDLENVYNDFFEETHFYKGLQYRLGLMYELPLDLEEARGKEDKPSKLLSAGFYVGGQTSLDISSDVTQLAINTLISDIDTAYFSEDTPSEGLLPGSWGFGVLYHHAGDFRVGLDYRSASWSKYENGARPESMMDAWRFGAGGAWIPDAGSITSYFKRVEYRAGFYTKKDPRVIEGSQVEEAALTFGASFPFVVQRNITWLEVGLDVGRRTGGDRLSDNFFRLNIGLVFNDNAWFIKGKYD